MAGRLGAGVAAIMLGLAAAGPARAVELTGETISGMPQVLAGDTLLMGGRALRLIGVAAPAPTAPGGVEARIGLYRLIDSHFTVCHLTNQRMGRALLAGCEAGGYDIGAVLIDRGLARECPATSAGRYRIQEARAKATGRALVFAVPAECGVPPVRAAGR